MAMRLLNAVLCVMLVGFVAVQYNDPDGPMWMVIYAIPAAFTGFAAFRPGRLLSTLPTVGLAVCIVAAVVGTVYWWPPDAQFWRPEVFASKEASLQAFAEMDREGMGMMIVTLVLVVVAVTRWRLASSRHHAA